MSTEDRWITTRISVLRSRHPSVTDVVATRIAQLLNGQLSEQQLSQHDLTSIAKELIADMLPTQPKTDAKQ